MREMLNDKQAEIINGGKYKLNGNNGKLLFTNDNRVFQLVNCEVFDAIKLLNGEMGKYSSDAEYDAHCIEALQNNGWVKVIGTR